MNATSDTNATGQDGCTLTDEEIEQSYHFTLHIVSVFVLLVVSFLGASLSVASSRVKFLHIHPVVLNTGKFFGSGVVLATGFIHILPDAMEQLTDPCLPDSWNQYGAYAGLFAMLAALGMQLIEYLAHQRTRSMSHKHSHIATNQSVKAFVTTEQVDHKTDGFTSIEQVHHQLEIPEQTIQINENINHIEHVEQIDNETGESGRKQRSRNKTRKSKASKEIETQNGEVGKIDQAPKSTEIPEQKDVIVVEIRPIEPPPPTSIDLCDGSMHEHQHGIAFQNDAQHHKISTYLLEFGIALHSVLIGLTLGTTTESFVPLFIALCFHQFFEAIALGAQIAELKTASFKSAIFMVIFFSFTTPVGIAIGIGIHSGTYNPKSTSSLLVTGTLDSLSAGILIYVALVNLISAEMGVNAHKFHLLSNRLKFLYFAALYLGAACMAVIGRWA